MSGLLMENYKRFAAGELTALRSKHGKRLHQTTHTYDFE